MSDQAAMLRELVATHGKATYEPFDTVVRRLQDELCVGKTTRQMIKAPIGSYFVWIRNDTHYATHLSRKWNRPDLRIVTPDWVSSYKWQGLDWMTTTVILDHAFNEFLQDEKFYNALTDLRSRFGITNIGGTVVPEREVGK